MTKYTYICDGCKSEHEKSDALTNVKAEANPYSSYSSYGPGGRRLVSFYKDLCEACCKKVGIVFVDPKNPEQQEEQSKNIESRLFEIFQEIVLMVTAQGGQQ